MRNVIGVALAMLAGLVLAACTSASGSESITGTTWQWSAMQETAPAHLSVVPDPENYTIAFNTDGSVEIKADCNNAGGSYTLSGSSLTIQVESSTMAYCGDSSQDQIYLQSLANASGYAIEDDSLQLIFANDGGKMDFNNGGTAQ
jgi:heat shock protein HslJ